MKFKNKLLALGLILISICTNEVKAGTIDDYKGATARLQYSPVKTHIAIPIIGIVNPLTGEEAKSEITRNLNKFEFLTNTGARHRALCMDALYHADQNGVYKITSVVPKENKIAYRVYQAYSTDTSTNSLALHQIATWMIFNNPKNVKWGNKNAFIVAYSQYNYSGAINSIFVAPSVFINKNDASDKYIDVLDESWEYYVDLLFTNDQISDQSIFKNYIYNNVLGSSSSSILASKINNVVTAAFVNMGVRDYIYKNISEQSATAAGNYYDKIHQGLIAEYSGDLCVYETTSKKAEMQRFIAPCAKGSGEPDPDIPVTPDPDLLYGEVETKEVYKTCFEGENDPIQGYTYEYYNPNKIVTEKTDLASGEFVKNIGSYCAVYCLENTAEIFPGSIKTAVGVGSYLIWPTSAATASSVYRNDYALKLLGTKECHVELAYGNTEYDKYINKTSDPVADVNTLYNEANKSARILYKGLYYETYRMDTDDGKDCDSRIFTNSCASDKAALDSALSAYGLTLDKYNNINNLYNIMIASANPEAYYNGPDGVKAAQAAASATKALEDKGLKPSPTSAAWTQEAINRTVIYNQMVASASTAKSNFVNAAGGNAGSWPSVSAAVSKLSTEYNSCLTALSACNLYASKVQEAINIANQIVSCANYDFNADAASKEIYNWQTNLNVSWEDPEYGTTFTDNMLEKSTSLTCTSCEGLGIEKLYSGTRIENIRAAAVNKIVEVSNALPNRKIIVHYETSYSLPTTGNLLYNYVNKTTYKAVTDINQAGDNYVTIGYSNMPISYDSPVGIKQNLSITDVSFGSNAKYSGIDYVCNYETSEDVSTCKCPEGTVNSGKNLAGYLINMTCADAQVKYCDQEIPEIPETETKCTTAEGKVFDITACMSAGMSKDECSDKVCGTYKCKNTNNVGGYMDITSCVQTKVAQGSTVSDAIDTCDATVCPLRERIIYRTISLANPFPGKDVSGLVAGFNTTVKGRYPGGNWNSTELVEKVILNNRGFESDSIYQGEPLYTFVLTPGVIKEIRSYNKSRESSGGYADYTLDCKLNNSTACVSDFVHNTIYGLTGGTCADSLGKNTFYKCRN